MRSLTHSEKNENLDKLHISLVCLIYTGPTVYSYKAKSHFAVQVPWDVYEVSMKGPYLEDLGFPHGQLLRVASRPVVRHFVNPAEHMCVNLNSEKSEFSMVV